MGHNQVKGSWGEETALRYLDTKGYRLIERHFRTRQGEIDLICMHQNILVLVEVKTRRPGSQVPLLETVDSNKIKRILKCAETYIDTAKLEFSEMRVDVVLITQDGNSSHITHLENYY